MPCCVTIEGTFGTACCDGGCPEGACVDVYLKTTAGSQPLCGPDGEILTPGFVGTFPVDDGCAWSTCPLLANSEIEPKGYTYYDFQLTGGQSIPVVLDAELTPALCGGIYDLKDVAVICPPAPGSPVCDFILSCLDDGSGPADPGFTCASLGSCSSEDLAEVCSPHQNSWCLPTCVTDAGGAIADATNWGPYPYKHGMEIETACVYVDTAGTSAQTVTVSLTDCATGDIHVQGTFNPALSGKTALSLVNSDVPEGAELCLNVSGVGDNSAVSARVVVCGIVCRAT